MDVVLTTKEKSNNLRFKLIENSSDVMRNSMLFVKPINATSFKSSRCFYRNVVLLILVKIASPQRNTRTVCKINFRDIWANRKNVKIVYERWFAIACMFDKFVIMFQLLQQQIVIKDEFD